MGMEDAVKELYRRREKAKLMGGEKRVKRQHNRGRFTARERLEKLLDPDSFWEMGLLNTSNVPGKEDITPCDGKIAGIGKIDGRKVAVFVQDPPRSPSEGRSTQENGQCQRIPYHRIGRRGWGYQIARTDGVKWNVR
jgi:acetyl-CoA carboxylase carboxyltransferase component